MMHIRVHFYNDESRINQTGVLIHEFTDSDILVPSRRSPLKGTDTVLRRDRGRRPLLQDDYAMIGQT